MKKMMEKTKETAKIVGHVMLSIAVGTITFLAMTGAQKILDDAHGRKEVRDDDTDKINSHRDILRDTILSLD